jgi:hypothetical protein
LLERTKVPLGTWLVVAWHLVQTKIGVSALSVQRIADVNYPTAWLLLQKMRAAMNQDEREKLNGDIEFDETYVGGVDPGAAERSRGKKSANYTAKTTTLSKTVTRAHLVHPHVHRVASLLKRWLLGGDAHQGAVRDQHLDAYLDEFVFRFNRRHARTRGLIFYRLICSLMQTRTPRYYQTTE